MAWHGMAWHGLFVYYRVRAASDGEGEGEAHCRPPAAVSAPAPAPAPAPHGFPIFSGPRRQKSWGASMHRNMRAAAQHLHSYLEPSRMNVNRRQSHHLCPSLQRPPAACSIAIVPHGISMYLGSEGGPPCASWRSTLPKRKETHCNTHQDSVLDPFIAPCLHSPCTLP